MSFQSAVYGFIPTSITGCQVWLDGVDPAGNGVVPANNATISTWADKSGNSNSPTSSSGTYPTYSLSSRCVTWNGGAAQLTFPSSLHSAVVGTAFTIFFVEQRTTGSENFIIRGSTQGTNQNLLIGHGGPSYATAWRFAFYGNDLDFTGLPTYASGEPATVSCFMYSKPNRTIYHNGAVSASVSDTNASDLASWSGAMIGGNSIWPAYYGNVFEMIIYRSSLTTTQRQQVEGYLAQKWGLTASLPSSHPGRSTTLYRPDYTKQNIMRALPYYTQFTPRQIPGCSHWFDATDSSTITLSSGSLTQWNDKSGNGRNLTAVSGFANATVSSAFQNGLNVFNFSGNGLYRTAAGNVSYPLDVYIIVALKSLTTHVDVLGMGDASVDNFNSLTFAESAASRWHNGSSGGARQTISTSNETSLSFLLIQWSIANGNYLLRRNGTQLIQASRNYSFNNSATAIFQIGFRHTDNVYGPNANFSGYIGEIIVFNNQIGTSDRQNVESYLAQKWDLTASLPGGHLHATQPAGAITLQSLANKQIVRRRVVYTINWTYTIPSQANLILQVNSRNWTSSASILDSITGVAWNMTNASLNSSRNTILMAGNGLFKYNNAGAGPSGFSGTQHTVMMVYYRLANATSASKGNPPSVTLNLTGYLYTINRTPATITNQLLAGENSSWVYQSAYQVGTNQTVLDGTTGWTFIAFVYTGTALNVYLNGQPENNPNSVSNPATTTLTNNYFSIFGNPRDNNAFINGELAFYGLWNTQLTAQNILDFYNTNKDQFLAFP